MDVTQTIDGGINCWHRDVTDEKGANEEIWENIKRERRSGGMARERGEVTGELVLSGRVWLSGTRLDHLLFI